MVQKGHTIEAIAHRYRVTVKAILEANHLKDGNHLKPGQVLIIPGPKKAGDKAAPEKVSKVEKKTKDPPPRTAAAAMDVEAPKERGHGDGNTIRAVRLGEEFRIQVRDAHGHIPPAALRAFERLMRQDNAVHAPDPRLIALLGIVSNHFGNKTIEVVSGYRAYTPTQYTPHSNHNYGKAIDFRIRGVKNESIRDFCLTLRNAGCGYYPNSTFVHLDVRDTKASWVDWSRPGEPPKYERPGTTADEGASDVPADSDPAANTAAAKAPGVEPPGARGPQ
jgi:uncharacterized protein YcbK (DUF882 family)